MRNVLLLGGRSEIGLAVASRLGALGASTVILAARPGPLEVQTAALSAAGVPRIVTVNFEANDTESHAKLLDYVDATYGPIDVAVVAFGVLGDQARAETDTAVALGVAQTNYMAHLSVLSELAQLMRRRGRGRIVVFSSVAGVRVRRANYVYGSTKAGLDGFASGLADSLDGSGVGLLLVRPGFVVGRMTRGMTPAPFASTPGQVADATVAALLRGTAEVWVPPVLRWVFAAMRILPRPVWRRLPR